MGVLQDNFVFFNWVDNVNRKLTFGGLALGRSKSRNCGFCVVYIEKYGATLLYRAYLEGNFFRCVRARAHLRAHVEKLCAVGMRNAIQRIHLTFGKTSII